MTTIVPRFAACKKCEGRTTVAFLPSIYVSREDSDYCPWSLGYNALNSDLSICPNCGFVGRANEFEVEEFEPVKDEKGYLINYPPLYWEENERLAKEYPMSRRFILYAKRIELEGASEKEIGEAYLHGSWAERINASPLSDRAVESITLERECQQNAVKYLSMALQKGELSPLVENTYLVGELHRRIGNFPEAIEYFRKATEGLEREKYYILILEDAGPQYDVVGVKVRVNTSIDKAEWQRISKSTPCKMLGDLTLDKAREWANLLSDLKATVSIKEQTELPNNRKEVLSWIDRMKAFAIQGDSGNKAADEKTRILT